MQATSRGDGETRQPLVSPKQKENSVCGLCNQKPPSEETLSLVLLLLMSEWVHSELRELSLDIVI